MYLEDEVVECYNCGNIIGEEERTSVDDLKFVPLEMEQIRQCDICKNYFCNNCLAVNNEYETICESCMKEMDEVVSVND